MIVGIFTFELYLPHSHSLKEKRKVVNMIRDKIKAKFNVSIAEVDFFELWQRVMFGIAIVNNEKKIVDSMFSNIIDTIEEKTGLSPFNIEARYE